MDIDDLQILKAHSYKHEFKRIGENLCSHQYVELESLLTILSKFEGAIKYSSIL